MPAEVVAIEQDKALRSFAKRKHQVLPFRLQ